MRICSSHAEFLPLVCIGRGRQIHARGPETAKNMANDIARPENMMQGLLRLHRLAVAFLQQTPPQAVDWIKCKNDLLKTDPPFKASVDAMIAFVSARSGGQDAWTLKDMAEFHSMFVKPSVRIALPDTVYNALAELRCHYLAIAIWKAAYSCPKEHVKGGVCSLYGASDINIIRTKPVDLVEALLSAYQKEIHRLELHDKIKVAWHSFQCNVAKACLAKPASVAPASVSGGAESRSSDRHLDRRKLSASVVAIRKKAADKAEVVRRLYVAFDTLEPTLAKHIQPAEVACFRKMLPAAPQAPQALPKCPTKVSPEATFTLGINEIDQTGKTINIRVRCRDVGFDLGTRLQKKAASIDADSVDVDSEDTDLADRLELEASGAFVLTGFDDGAEKVKLHRAASGDAASVDLELGIEHFLLKFEAAAKEIVVVKHAGWPRKRLFHEEVFALQNTKAEILVALSSLIGVAHHRAPLDDLLEVYSKPSKVVAKKAISPGTLIVVPECRKVHEIARSARDEEGNPIAPPSGAVEVTFTPKHPSHRFWLLPALSAEWVGPYWLIPTTAEPDKATVKEEYFSVPIMSAVDYVGTTALSWAKSAKRSRTKVTQEKLEKQMGDEQIKTTICIPVLVNAGDVAESGALLRFAPAAAKKTQQKKSITVKALVQKQALNVA